MIKEEGVIQNILSDVNLAVSILGLQEYPLPEPYKPIGEIKAFILGADPSNFTDNNQTRKISYVFDIGNDKRYFNSINQNLSEIDLTIENIYVENMVRNYMDKETQANTKWELFADKWLPYIKQEFDKIDADRKLPVFITAEIILKFLSNNPFELGIPRDYYNGFRKIPILPSQNKLERNLIPFYRHSFYSLKKQEFYRDKIIEVLEKI